MKQASESRITLFASAMVLAARILSTSSYAFNFNTVTDPFMILHIGVFGLKAKHIEVNKAKVSAASFGLATKTPTLCFPTLGCVPQYGSGRTKVHFSRSTVTKGGSTVRITVPGLDIGHK